MRKLAVLLMITMLVCGLAINVSANYDAFSKIEVTPDVTLIDDATTQDQGGSGQPIQYVEGYGVRYASKNDIVYFENVDFGTTGAKEMTINFAYGNDNRTTTNINVFIDDYKSGKPVGTLNIGFTGGWELTTALPLWHFVTIPGGIHTVYIQFGNEKSGSFNYITFAAVSEHTAHPAAPTDTVTTAAQTADIGIISGAIALAGASLVIIALKKRK